MIQVTVKLFAILRLNRKKEIILEMHEGVNVDSILEHLVISRQDATIMMVNGRHVRPEHILKNGDTLSLFPPVGGG